MKKLTIIICILFSISLFSQEIKIYENDNYGIQELTPSTIITTTSDNNTYNQYDVDEYGIKELIPIKVLEVNENQIDVYNTNEYGIKDLFPSETIKLDTNY